MSTKGSEYHIDFDKLYNANANTTSDRTDYVLFKVAKDGVQRNVLIKWDNITIPFLLK